MSTAEKTGTGTALRAAAAFVPDAIGWAYSPSEAYWLRRVSGRLLRMGQAIGRAARDERDATEVDATDRLDQVFELRLFTVEAELRWTHEAHGQGRWVVVDDESAEQAGLTRLGGAPRRLLWGRVAAARDSWARLSDARIGSLWVPVDQHRPRIGDHVCIEAVEYIRTDRHGNASVADERCTGLSPLPRQSAMVRCTASTAVEEYQP